MSLIDHRSHEPVDRGTVSGWVVKGFVGCCSMVLRCAEHGLKFTTDERAEISAAVGEILAVLDTYDDD